MSESFINAIFLLMSGGFQNAYTYFFRGNVFANAQTGNFVLMSSYIFKLDFENFLRYCIPIIFFAIGIFIAEHIHFYCKEMQKIHWRQLILIIEIILLFIVGFIPENLNILANSIVSFVCAMQVQAFKKINGKNYATTMCIGNLRSSMESLSIYFNTKDKNALKSSSEFFTIILLFTLGAGLGYKITDILGIKAIWISCVLLSISFCIMRINSQNRLTEENK